MSATYFYDMIHFLFSNGEVAICDKTLAISEEDEKKVTSFLREIYDQERFDYPFEAPAFDEKAAVWAAKMLYCSSQLLLYRDMEPENVGEILQLEKRERSAAAILSADLCLRFLPSLLQRYKIIDNEDLVIPLLEDILLHFHYSAIGYPLAIDSLEFGEAYKNNCLMQLYADRVTTKKVLSLALLPELKTRIKENLGLYSSDLWAEFNTQQKTHESIH